MITFLKYLFAFCLLTIAASLALCSYAVYGGIQTANKLFAGADNYTCRQFAYDMQQPETDKLPAILIAVAAYGYKDVTPTESAGQGTPEDDEFAGVQPSLQKVSALCQGQPDARVLNLFAQSVTKGIVSGTVPVVSPSSISTTTQQ